VASIFEAPPQPARSRFPSGLPQIAAAFAAGIVVAVVVARPGPAPEKVPPGPPASKISTTTAAVPVPKTLTKPEAPARAEPAPPAPVTASAPPLPPPARAEAPASADAGKSAEAPAQAAACNQQWPYLGKGCSEPDTNTGEQQKSIRVIGVDQTAPASIVADSKPQPEPLPAKTPESRTSGAVATAPVVPSPAVPATNGVFGGSSPVSITSAPAPTLQPAPTAVAPTAAPAAPLLDPRTTARSDPAPRVKQQVTIHREATKPKRERERAANGQPGERAANWQLRERVRNAEPPREEIKEQPERREEAIATRPRRDDDMNAERRPRDVEARNERDGFSLVRSRVLPDGRRITVYRKYDDNSGRVPERRPAPQSIFGLPFGGSDDDDN
jgi:hypothetical protein